MKRFGTRLLLFATSLTLYSQVLAAGDLSWQRDFIARFSGATPLVDGTILEARSSSDQRRIAAELLVDELDKRGLSPELHRYLYPNIHFVLDLVVPPFKGQNVFARIPATVETDSHVVVGAHYDSVPDGPGANDNGTGVAAVLAIAEAIAAMDEGKHTFLIVFFDHEEEDGAGSRAFARKLFADGISLHSMHNVDMVGWIPDRPANLAVGSSDLGDHSGSLCGDTLRRGRHAHPD